MKKTGKAIIRANRIRCMTEAASDTGKGMEDIQAALARCIDPA